MMAGRRLAAGEGLGMSEVTFYDPRIRIRRLVEPELRKDPVVERWVIISTDRLGRAQELHAAPPPTRMEACPFCVGHEQLTPHESFVFPDGEGWRIRVVPNAYPALRRGGPFRPIPTDGFERWSGWGVHEVVIECPQHESSLANLPATHVADLFRVYRQRIRAGKEDAQLVYPMIFKNSGADAGATLEHSHSQIILLPCVPLTAREELDGAARF